MAKKMNLPPINLDLKLESGKMKAITSVATGKTADYVVPVDQLRVLPGFNVRVRETEDYAAHVENLKQSIRENGYYANKPLAGFIGKEGEEDVIYVTDGHTRLEAVQAINAEALNEGEEIAGLPVSLKPADATIADLTIALVQDNSGRPLTPYEMGVVVQRLSNMTNDQGEPLYSKTDIARRLSITERYIDDLNVLVDAPAKVRNAVLEGAVSSTLAIQELRKNPKKAEQRIVDAVNKAKASGKTKATKKDVGVRMVKVRGTVSLAAGSSIKDALKALAGQVRETVKHDSEDALLTDGTITVIMEVPAPEKPAAAPKAAKKAAAPKKAAPAKKASTKKQTVQKPSKANGGVGGDPVVPAADEGEPAKLPPKVESNDDPNDI